MSRRENTEERCAVCQMHATLCLCAETPRVAAKTRLLLLVHYREARRTTNTGQLAARCLADAEVVITGRREAPARVEPGPGAVLLYPSEDAAPLASLRGQVRTLVVPDGNWRQAGKARARLPGLAGLPCARLEGGGETRYRLRSEPKAGGLATLEAIARALAILEGEEIARPMLEVFEKMVARTLWTRGELPAREVPGGIPAAALARFGSGRG